MAILQTPNGTIVGMIPEELVNAPLETAPAAPKKRTRKKAEEPDAAEAEKTPEE